MSTTHLQAMGRMDSRECFRRKLELSRILLDQGFREGEVTALLRFLDWVFQLPRELELHYENGLKQLLGEERMPYVASWERFAEERGLERGLARGLEQGIERGIEQGITKGELLSKRRILIRHLDRKFGLEQAEQKLIETCESSALLDDALDTVLFAKEKNEVLIRLKGFTEAKEG